MTDIISLTPAAIAHIKQQIAADDQAIGFRLGVKQTGCNGYMYVPEVIHSANPHDVTLAIDENLIVYIPKDAVEKIRGTKIDFLKKDLGAEVLVYDNPRASGLCGCGESFNIDE